MFLHMWSNMMGMDIVGVMMYFMDDMLIFWMECWRKSHWEMMISSPFFFKDLAFLTTTIMSDWMDVVWA